MNKLAKGFLIAIAIIVALVTIAVLAINLYMESDDVRLRAEAALSSELGRSVTISRVHFSPLGALRVVGVTIPQADAPKVAKAEQKTADNFLTAGEISGSLCWTSLFSERIVITRFVISDAVIVWRQDAKGQFVLPSAPKASEPAPTPTPTPKPVAAGVAEAKQPPFELKIVTARLENCSFTFQDKKGVRIAAFEGVNVECKNITPTTAEGLAKVQTARLHADIQLTDFSTPFSFNDGFLDLSKIQGQLCGGTIKGAFTMSPLKDNAPFTVDMKVDSVNLPKLLADTGMDTVSKNVTGSIFGDVQVGGRLKQPKSLKGTGHLSVKGGGIQKFELFEGLQIDALNALDLNQARTAFRISDAIVHVEELLLQTPNVRISATGTVDFVGKLDLDAALGVNQKTRNQLPNWLSGSFQPVDNSDESEVRFNIGGTVERPSTDLVRLLMGQKLNKQVMSVYDFLNGGKRKEKDKDKNKERQKNKENKESTADKALKDLGGLLPGLAHPEGETNQ